jgi:hypothetical protein
MIEGFIDHYNKRASAPVARVRHPGRAARGQAHRDHPSQADGDATGSRTTRGLRTVRDRCGEELDRDREQLSLRSLWTTQVGLDDRSTQTHELCRQPGSVAHLNSTSPASS